MCIDKLDKVNRKPFENRSWARFEVFLVILEMASDRSIAQLAMIASLLHIASLCSNQVVEKLAAIASVQTKSERVPHREAQTFDRQYPSLRHVV